jgi:hypothetical protein
MDAAFWVFTYIVIMCLYFMIRLMFVHPDDFYRKADTVFISALLWPLVPFFALAFFMYKAARKLNVWFHKTRTSTKGVSRQGRSKTQ